MTKKAKVEIVWVLCYHSFETMLKNKAYSIDAPYEPLCVDEGLLMLDLLQYQFESNNIGGQALAGV